LDGQGFDTFLGSFYQSANGLKVPEVQKLQENGQENFRYRKHLSKQRLVGRGGVQKDLRLNYRY
jgi:hypothetical protein